VTALLTPDEIEAALQVMQDAFKQVRPYILERAGKSAHTSKSDGSPVTEADVAVEKVILDTMARHFPGMPVLGEESGYDEHTLPPICWLIDPIDGTKSFIENLPAYTNTAVLMVDGQPAASIICNIVTNDVYTAKKGGGAYKNGKRLDLANLPLPRVAYCKGRFVDALNELLKPAGVTCEVGPNGGSFGFSSVAEGRIAARFNFMARGYLHDYVTGALLVLEAGGAVISTEDGPFTPRTRSFVACHPKLAPLIRQHASELRELELRLQDA
jgi:fructose-1,6-bisphosphatase/inositol monophosphatase family enzyme